MPPKITDTQNTSAEALHAVEAETAEAARKVVAAYAEDFFDGVTLMCMLGVEPEGLSYRKVAAEQEEAAKKATKKTSKKTAAKKATKKATKKTTAKKSTKKTTKKTTAKKTTKKAAKKTTAKKTTKKAAK